MWVKEHKRFSQHNSQTMEFKISFYRMKKIQTNKWNTFKKIKQAARLLYEEGKKNNPCKT